MSRTWIARVLGAAVIAGVSGCGGVADTADATADSGTKLAGAIVADGSSTVGPITQAVAETFAEEHPGVKITVGETGTGGGFKRFAKGETDISNASRPMKQSEIDECAANGVEFIEIPVAYDALTVAVSSKNEFVESLTVDELKRIWTKDSTVKTWKDVRPVWPADEILLFGAGQSSGTYDYFQEAIPGKDVGIRLAAVQMSENDNDLVRGVAGSKFALGYFGFGYYSQNTDTLKAVRIDAGAGPVAPSIETVMDGSYRPLSRPLFIYVNKKAATRPEIKAFVELFLGSDGRTLVEEEGFVPLTDEVYGLSLKRFQAMTAGSMFGGKDPVGLTVESLKAKLEGK